MSISSIFIFLTIFFFYALLSLRVSYWSGAVQPDSDWLELPSAGFQNRTADSSVARWLKILPKNSKRAAKNIFRPMNFGGRTVLNFDKKVAEKGLENIF